MALKTHRHWRTICEEVLRQRHSAQVDKLLRELLDALDQLQQERKEPLRSSADLKADRQM